MLALRCRRIIAKIALITTSSMMLSGCYGEEVYETPVITVEDTSDVVSIDIPELPPSIIQSDDAWGGMTELEESIIASIFTGSTKTIRIGADIDEDKIKKIWNKTMSRIEAFYVDGYSMVYIEKERSGEKSEAEKIIEAAGGKTPKDSKLTGIKIIFNRMPRECIEAQKQINKEVKRIASLCEDTEEWDKALFAYNYVASNVEYDNSAKDCKNIYGALINKRASCIGLAQAYQAICRELGVAAQTMYGFTAPNGEAHAWNIVKINSEYAYVDCTLAMNSIEGRLNATYFCMGDDELRQKYTVNMDYMGEPPECPGNLWYFRYRDEIFEKFDKEEVYTRIRQGLEEYNGEIELNIQCRNEKVYEAYWNELIEQRGITKLCKLMGKRVRIAYNGVKPENRLEVRLTQY